MQFSSKNEYLTPKQLLNSKRKCSGNLIIIIEKKRIGKKGDTTSVLKNKYRIYVGSKFLRIAVFNIFMFTLITRGKVKCTMGWLL